MKIDLCKLFNVEEGEEFKFEGYEYTYNIKNSLLYILNEDRYAHLEVNDLVNKEIIKLPKKKKFTDNELYILKNVDKRYKWIAKDKNGLICTFVSKPIKTERFWNDGWSNGASYASLEAIKNSLFSSIQWEDEEPIYIDDYVER